MADKIGSSIVKKIIGMLVGVAVVVLGSNVRADVILDMSGNVIQVTDIIVDGTSYDATFHVGSFNGVFGAGFPVSPEPTFVGSEVTESMTRAASAVDAILDQINALAPSQPLFVTDANGFTSNLFLVPYSYTPVNVATQFGSNDPNFGATPPTWHRAPLNTPRASTVFQTGIYSYVKFSPSPVLGDANGDGVFNNFDISAFVLALTNPGAYQSMYPDVDPDVVLDMNGKGGFDNFDIAGFVAALTSNGTE